MRDKPTNYIGRLKYCGIWDELILFTLDGTRRITVGNKTKEQVQSDWQRIKMTETDKANLEKMLVYLFGDGK